MAPIALKLVSPQIANLPLAHQLSERITKITKDTLSSFATVPSVQDDTALRLQVDYRLERDSRTHKKNDGCYSLWRLQLPSMTPREIVDFNVESPIITTTRRTTEQAPSEIDIEQVLKLFESKRAAQLTLATLQGRNPVAFSAKLSALSLSGRTIGTLNYHFNRQRERATDDFTYADALKYLLCQPDATRPQKYRGVGPKLLAELMQYACTNGLLSTVEISSLIDRWDRRYDGRPTKLADKFWAALKELSTSATNQHRSCELPVSKRQTRKIDSL